MMNLNKKLQILFSCFLLLALSVPPLIGLQESTRRIKYEIWVELDGQNKMLHGRERIIWINQTQDAVQDMWFHLYYNAFKNEKSTMFQESKEESFGPLGMKVEDGEWGWIDVVSIKLADGRSLLATMEFMQQDEPVHPGDQTVMRVLFPEPIMPGEDVQLEIDFQSKIPRGLQRTGYYKDSYFIAQWFPKPGVYEEGKGWNCHEYHLSSEFYADFADFTVHITVPDDFIVGASGKQIRATANELEETVTHTFSQASIHDFAWTADPNFLKVERDFIADEEVSAEEYDEVSRRLWIPVEEVKLNDVKMILLIRKEHKKQINRHFQALKSAIKYYGLWYGSYPYETVTMVDPPFRTGSGGMEYPTLFTAGTSILRSKDVHSPEGVIIHEFGHGYWYGLCANNEFEEAWLDEGINTYSTGKVLAQAYGPGAFPVSFNRIPLNRFIEMPTYVDCELDRAAGIHVVELDPITTYSWRFYNRGSYGLNVYFRASTCLNTLEGLVGQDTMIKILRAFQMGFRFKHPRTQDFIDVVNEVSGRDFTWFFEELFFSTLNFDYGVSFLDSREKEEIVRGIFDENGRKEELTGKEVENLRREGKENNTQKIYITDVVARRFGEARLGGDMTLKLKIVFEDGSEEVRLWRGRERWKKFRFEGTSKVSYAHIDPDDIWLVDSNRANNSLKRNPSRSGIWKVTSHFFFFVQNFLQLISGLS
jgi:hypothetical protein